MPMAETSTGDAGATLADLRSELSTLNRVSHRLAMTDAGPQLQKVLTLLLPRLLGRVGKNDDAKREHKRVGGNKKRKEPGNTGEDDGGAVLYGQIDGMHQAIHGKLVEMLGHAMKRVREDRGCKLPCLAILELLLPASAREEDAEKRQEEGSAGAVTANPFTINLGLAFLTLGINRCSPVECAALLPGLLTFLGCNFDRSNNGMGTNNTVSDDATAAGAAASIGVSHLLDPSKKMRTDQTWHLILRCLEFISHNPTEAAATRRAAEGKKTPSSASNPSEKATGTAAEPTVASSLRDTKRLLASDPVLASALFDLFADVLLYSPVPANSTMVPNGLSPAAYRRLTGGAASEKSGCKGWREEFVTRGSLRTLKLKLLDLVAPCRRHALFLPEKPEKSGDTIDGRNDGGSGRDKNPSGEVESARGPNSETVNNTPDGTGVSRTVALMVLLSGDSEPDVKSKAESYLRAHMDTYRGKEVPQAGSGNAAVGGAGSTSDEGKIEEVTVHDALLGNSVALAHQLLLWAVGGAASVNILKGLASQYETGRAKAILSSRLGLTYCADTKDAGRQKAVLSCHRTKVPQATAASTLKFVGKMLEDNPKLFHVGMDMEEEESDVAAVSIGTLVLAVLGDAHRPGLSASLVMESAASLLNSLCVRLSLFYDARVQIGLNVSKSLERLRLLLARSMARACAVLAPTSSGESTSVANDGTRASKVQIDVRDRCYGVVCTLARSQFSLDDRCALFDCGKSDERGSFPLTTISAAKLLFGCASNEAEVLRPRATSALDALLGGYVRVVEFLEEKKSLSSEERAVVDVVANPWVASVSEPVAEAMKTKQDISMEGLSLSLLPLLWNAARRSQSKSSRLAAARWSSELLLRLHSSNAYHLLCFLSGDDDATVSMIAKEALGVEKLLGEDNSLASELGPLEGGKGEASADRVTFGVLMVAIIGFQSSTKSRRPQFADFHVRAQAATLRFLLRSLFSEDSFYGDEDASSALKEFVRTILTTLAFYKDRSLSREETDLLDECSIALSSCTSTSKDARVVVLSSDLHYGYEDIARQAITSNSSKARRHLSEVMGHLYEDNLWQSDNVSIEPQSISEWVECTGLTKIAKSCREKLATMFEASFAAGEVHGAAFLGSSCVRAFRLAAADEPNQKGQVISDCWEHCCGIVSLLGKGLAHPDIVIGNACGAACLKAFSYDGQDAPILSQELFDAMAIVMDQMKLALKKFSSIDHADPTRASSLIRAAGLLLAASTSGAGFTKGTVIDKDETNSVNLGPARLQCTEALFGILGSPVYRKDEELSLVVGEALVNYSDALGGGEWSTGADSEWKEGPYEETYAFDLPPHQHVLYTMFRREMLSSNPLKRNSCAAALLALIGQASRSANIDPSLFIQRAFVQEVWKHLSSFQSSFIKLLADPKSKQLSRESCCKGLAACRGLAAVITSSNEVHNESQSQVESLNEKLLKAFGQTTNYGQSAMMESEAQADERRNEGEGNNEADNRETTQVGGVAGISEASLGAYREMASAAIALGKVDILYSLLILSTNHPIWQVSEIRDRYSARALLGRAEGVSVEEIRISLRPHLVKLIPKLLRASNDPSKETRRNMNNLWLALTGGGAESRAIINQHLLPTIDALIQDAGGKLWRARSGAAGALADIIVGRSWQDLGGGGIELDDDGSGMKTASIRLLRLWKITMRALDDVRTAVRERGETLGRAVRALTIRLCDPTMTDLAQDSDVYLSNAQRKQREKQQEISAENAATVSLGWLVKYGLNQPCAEATGICVSCLLGIVDVAKPSTLQPVLAELIGSLLMAMSSLEPAALNYLQVRAAGNDTTSQGTGPDRYDRLERMRINLALSGPIAGALHKCLEMVEFVDLDAQRKLIPELDSSLRKGAGFATRAATADAVGTLCSKCPAAFSFTASNMSNPTVRLLRALYFASERERGVTAKDKMTHALGSLAVLAPGKAVRILALKACERYCESSGSNNDPSVRKAAAATIRAVAVRASNHLADGGPRDIWCKRVLPTAFLGRHDKDAKISSLWKDVWEEGGSVTGSMRSDDVFGVLLQEKLLPYIVKATASALQSTSWANRRAGCAVLIELTDANILAPISRSIGDGNQFSVVDTNRLKQRATASSVLLSECLRIIARNRVWEGKGDVVKAATAIAGKWSAIAPMNGKGTDISDKCTMVPLVIQNNSRDDLFSGDGWFKLSEAKLSDGNNEYDEVGSDDEAGDETDGQNSEDDAALDLSGINDLGDDEQINEEKAESGVEESLASQPVVFSGFCQVLLDQALRTGSNNTTEGVLPYKASALGSLSSLLKSIVPAKDSKQYIEAIEHQHFIYDLVAPRLFSFIAESLSSNGKQTPPLLIARALECLASAMYNGIDADAGGAEYADAGRLLKFFVLSTGKQPAWTVRQMSALAASSLVAHIPSGVLTKTEVITTVLECSKQTLKDKKFWKVRLSGLELLLSLVNRVGNQKMSSVDPEKQLIMEAILPYKEMIIDLARRSLADNESQVTAKASKITLAMAWWP